MRNDYAINSACAADVNQKARDVCSKPNEPCRPLLSEAFDRLQCVRDGLMDANGRLSGATIRILGPEPAIPCAPSGVKAGGQPCAADELLDMIRSIAIQVERLHDVASRVERIG